MCVHKIAFWLRRHVKKDTFLWWILKSCYGAGRKISGIVKAGLDKYEKDWYVNNIQLEITYRCNKLCQKCNRFCNLTKLPFLQNADMSVEQIEKFTGQIRQKNIRLNRIEIMGGEPFLHPGLKDFISRLFYKLMVPGNVLSIEIVTNGIIDPGEVLKDCRSDPRIDKAFSEGRISVSASLPEAEKAFTYVLSAPVDSGLKWDMCAWPRDLGVSLNTYGYWPGGVCGALALLLGKTEYARYDFPVKFREAWPNLKEDLCKYCAVGCKELMYKASGRVSSSYMDAISKWMRGVFGVPEKF
jgi:hypothetical protein